MAGLEKIIKVLKQAPKVVDEVPSLLTILGRAGVPAEAAKITKPLGKDAALEAVRKIAERSKKADDWGWKGGKPGEITGDRYIQAVFAVDAAPKGKLREAKKVFNELDKKFAEQLNYGDMGRLFPPAIPTNSVYGDRFNIAREFSAMQKADIPREWTGKLSTALQKRSKATGTAMPPYAEYSRATRYVSPPGYQAISDAMRPMTNDQRETFLSLLPEWDGTLDDLAEAAKNL